MRALLLSVLLATGLPISDAVGQDKTQSSNYVFCTGTGKIEGALLQSLEARLVK